MSLYRLLPFLLFLFASGLRAQPNCVDERQCRSQLFRFEVSNAVLRGSGDSFLPLLNELAHSPTLNSLIATPREIHEISLPPKSDICDREKANGNPLYAQVDCQNRRLCSDGSVSETVKTELCFHLPCPVFEGTLLTGKCNGKENIHATSVSFPSPLQITNINLAPTSVEFQSPRAKLCFRVDQLSLNASVQMNIDTTGTALPDSGLRLNNIRPSLDGPRDVCVKANIDLTSGTPVSQMEIETPAGTPFISDAMVRAAAGNVAISGLSGYPPEALERVKGELLPVMFTPIRDSIESALKSGLSHVFESELNKYSRNLGTNSLQVNTQSMMSEVGLGNFKFRETLAKVQCRALADAGRPVPMDHPCRADEMFASEIGRSTFPIGLTYELMRLKEDGLHLNLTSEQLKQELLALKDLMRAKKNDFDHPEDRSDFAEGNRRRFRGYIEDDIAKYVDPVIDRISQNQLRGQIVNFVEFQDLQQGNFGRNVGVDVPEICSDTNPSPHARRSIPNCPVQAYTDLNEMNSLLSRMWQSGTICQAGQGPYVDTPERFDRNGIPNGTGCEIEMNGMRCFLDSAPGINWNARTRKYQTRVKLKACHRHGVFLDIGRFGGDFNITLNYVPRICENGDFCLGRTTSSLTVVPGTERFDLVPSSTLRTRIMSTLESAVSDALRNSIRIPFSSRLQNTGSIPLRPDGRTDTGPGYFGACLTTSPQ